MRSRLSDRSGIGQQRLAQILRADLARASAIDTSALSHTTRTSVEVVRSAYSTALEGFQLPYGDVAVGGWRNTPYVVIQNVGAYLDTPRFLDAEHQINTADDAEAYLARLQSYPQQLDNELGRVIMAALQGPDPARLPDRQGARAAEGVRRRRAQGRRPGRLARPPRPRKGHRRRLGPPRPHHRHRRSRARARPPDRRADAAARPRHQRSRHVGPPERRRILPLGAQGLDHDHDFAGRDPPDRPRHLARPARPDGHDPQGHRLHPGRRRRADAGAGQGPQISLRRQRQGPRRRDGLHPGAAAR